MTQLSINRAYTSMNALMVHKGNLENVEQLMKEIQHTLPEGEVCEISNINSATQVVLSGTTTGVDYASSLIYSKGFSGRALCLPVSAPFHCRLMKPASEIMVPALDAIFFKMPIIDVISNVTGRPVYIISTSMNHRRRLDHCLRDK